MPTNLRRKIALAFPLRWEIQRPYFVPSHPPLGRYYIDWFPGTDALGEDWSVAPHDRAGVILTPSLLYHPVRIAQYALHHHARWFSSGDENSLGIFLKQAAWLRDNQEASADIRGLYRYGFPNVKYRLSSGWISAMAQGEAISVLLRAHVQSPADGFFDAAVDAAQPFRFDVREGGVVWRDGSDVYLEEIAADPPTHILNGFIFAWWGLWELLTVHDQKALRRLVEQSLDTLTRKLPLYDAGYWSYYELNPISGFQKVATLKYHAFHIAQLLVLAAMTRERLFERTAQRWAGYVSDYRCRARMLAKTLQGVVIDVAHVLQRH